MEFDWSGLPFNGMDGKEAPTMREIEETFEDPHSLRLLPDSPRFAEESRTFCLGKTLNGRGVFSGIMLRFKIMFLFIRGLFVKMMYSWVHQWFLQM